MLQNATQLRVGSEFSLGLQVKSSDRGANSAHTRATFTNNSRARLEVPTQTICSNTAVALVIVSFASVTFQPTRVYVQRYGGV